MGWFSKVWRGVKKVVKKVVNFVKKTVNSVISFVGGLVGGMFSVPDLGSVSGATQENEGVLLNRTGTLNNIPVIYGQRKVGGTIVYMDTEGAKNEALYMAVLLGEGKIESIGNIFIDGVLSTDTRFTAISGTVNTSKNTGSKTQSADAILTPTGKWTSAHKLSGLAYLGCKFKMPEVTTQEQADKNPWSGIPKVQALIKGKIVASAASAGSGTYDQDTDASSTTSSNPADVILDYLRNPIYGRGLENDSIDFPSFAAARILYNTQVTLANGSTTAYIQINPAIDTGLPILDNLKKLLVQSRAGLPYQQGKFHLRPENSGSTSSPVDPTPASSFDITEEMIQEGIQIDDPGTKNQANQVRVSYIEPNNSGEDNDWSTQEVIYPQTGSARDIEMLAEDQGRRVVKEYNLSYITNGELAAYHAKLLCENERRIKTVSVNCSAEAHDVTVGDIVRLEYTPLGINYAYYRVVSWEIDDDYTISLGLREHVPANYVFDNTDVTFGYTKQRLYVGDTGRVTTYEFQGDTGNYEAVTGVLDGDFATLPNMDIFTGVTNSNFLINTVTVLSTFDRPGFAFETLRVNMTIPALLTDTYQIDLVEYNNNTDTWTPLTTLTPGVHRVSGNVYEMDVNIEMDGLERQFQLRVHDKALRNVFISIIKTITASRSIFIKRIVTLF